jgi:hypothetical protein
MLSISVLFAIGMASSPLKNGDFSKNYGWNEYGGLP